eukprot:s1069_g7.t1
MPEFPPRDHPAERGSQVGISVFPMSDSELIVPIEQALWPKGVARSLSGVLRNLGDKHGNLVIVAQPAKGYIMVKGPAEKIQEAKPGLRAIIEEHFPDADCPEELLEGPVEVSQAQPVEPAPMPPASPVSPASPPASTSAAAASASVTRQAPLSTTPKQEGVEKDVLIWTDMEGDCSDAATVSGSLLGLVGGRPDTKPRTLSTVKESDFSVLLGSWRIPREGGEGRAPTLVEIGQAQLFLRACQLVGGQGQTIDELRSAATRTTPGVPIPSQSSSPARKVKLNSVVSQVDDTEVKLLTENELIEMYAEYERVYGTGERPTKDCEPTTEQISSIAHLLDNGQPPFADFAIFGPYGHRIERKLKLSGISIGRDGVIRQVELHGPPNIGTWLASYNVLMTILVMKKAVDLGVLLKYRSHIERLHDRYSEKIWAVLYQAETRCRLELMDRLRREATAEHEAAIRAGGTSSFDPQRPWNTAWLRAVNHEAFWREEVIEPGMLILTKVAGVNEMVEGDATIKGNSMASNPREPHAAPARMTHAPSQPSSSTGQRARKANRSGRVHQIEDGKYTLNRTGFKICEGYQSGECAQTTSGIWCSQQWDTVHQCNRCLGNHPSKNCPHKDVQVPGFVKRDKGKGQGKNKKGGKRAPY